MQNTIILIITCLIILLLIRSLCKLLFSDLKGLCYFFYKPFVKTKHYKKADYNKAFNYLLKRKTITKAEQREERLFFLSLINEATHIKQLKEFTEQIKKFYRKKVKIIATRKFKNQQQTYNQQYKEIVIFLIMAIKNRFEIITEFDALNDYHAFVKLILQANEVTAIDAILIFAEKLKPSDYKKIQRLAEQKKAILEPHIASKEQSTTRFSLVKLITHTVSSTVKYLILGYLLMVFSSLALSLVVPNLVTASNDKLLLLANTLKAQPFIPHFAKLNTGYFIINNKVQFYKQANFLQQQKNYYLTMLTAKLCKIATFSKVCYRNR